MKLTAADLVLAVTVTGLVTLHLLSRVPQLPSRLYWLICGWGQPYEAWRATCWDI